MRSCEFFGVQGVVMTTQMTGPLSPTTSKVSAGAMELVTFNVTDYNNHNHHLKVPLYTSNDLARLLAASV